MLSICYVEVVWGVFNDHIVLLAICLDFQSGELHLRQQMIKLQFSDSKHFVLIFVSAWSVFSDTYTDLCSCSILLPPSFTSLLCAAVSVYSAGCMPGDETDVQAILEWSSMLHQDLDFPLDIWMLLGWEACLRPGGCRSLVAINIGSLLLFKRLVH